MIIPKMIQLARESRGWTQADLATAIGVSQGAISKYEAGTLAVPAHHGEAIAERLGYTFDLLTQVEPMYALGGDFLYRRKANVTVKARRQVEAEAHIRALQLKRLLKSVSIDAPRTFPAISPEEKCGRIERVAAEVRRIWRIPRGPIQNVSRLLENHGVIIFLMDFASDDIDGTNLLSPGIPPLMFMNRNVSGERHRFNLAHELGHLVMHFEGTSGDPEVEAYTFAREFLMPREDIRSDLRNLDLAAAARLKQVWGTSMQSIIYHAWRLRQITESKYRRLFTSLSATGNRSIEPFPLEFEMPEAFDRILKFYREQLGWNNADLDQLMFTEKLGMLTPPAAKKLRLSGLWDESELD